MQNELNQFDFFVSYARVDNAGGWITSFVAELLAEHKKFSAGRELKPFFDQHAITNGADWQLYIAHGVAHSRLFLAFISPNYFASESCRKEWRAWIDAEIAQHILTEGVRPVYIVEVPGLIGKDSISEQQVAQKVAELCRLPEPHEEFLAATSPVVKQLRRRDFSKTQVQNFFTAGLEATHRADLRAVLKSLAKDLDHHADLLRRADGSLSTVPAYNAKFTGRLDELMHLRAQLIKDDRTGIISGVHGLGGIGKTELAFTYAHAFASAYPGGRFILGCENKSTLRDAVLGQSDFLALFRDKINDEERKQPEIYFAAVVACLRERLASLGHTLLVLDNVTNPAMLLHQQTGCLTVLGPNLHLLATTRLPPPAGGKGDWLTLGQLLETDALDLMEKHRPFASNAEQAAALKIVKRLGGFTLAVELMAAHLAAHPGITCAQLADAIGLEDLENPEVLKSGAALRYDHDLRLSAVITPVLASLTPMERRALEYGALLPPDQVPLPWLRTLVAADFPEAVRALRLTNPWDDLWRHLEKLALFSSDNETTEPRLLRVHRLVQQLVRREWSKAQRTARQQAVDAFVVKRFNALENTTRWEDVRWELEPFTALAWLWDETKHPQAVSLLNEVGLFWENLADWSQAEPLMRRALAINETNFGPVHPNVAIGLNNLAGLLKTTNRLSEAEPLYRRALAINEMNYGPEHPTIARSLSNLAQLFKTTNRLLEAEPLMRRALAMDEKILGPDHYNVANYLNNLADLLQDTNRPAEAEPLYRRALAIQEKNFGAEHPAVAKVLNNLAQLLQDSKQLAEAELMNRRALEINQRSFGPDHPTVAVSLASLAHLMQATDRLGEAEPLMRQALAIWEKSLGPDHPDVAVELNNLARVLQRTNRLGEAEALMRRALAIDEKSFRPEHPNVAIRLNNLAHLLRDTNRLGEAEPLMRRQLEIFFQFTRTTGHQHPFLQVAIKNYEHLLKAMGRTHEEVLAQLRAMAPEFFPT